MKILQFKQGLLVFIFLFLASCQESDKVPALLDPSNLVNQHTQFIQEALAELKPGSKIIISETAFINNSEIIVEPNNASLPVSQNTGRDYYTSDHFKLWLLENHCILEHVESEQFVVLENIQCIPNPAFKSTLNN